ncbi:MAG: hypothetical protein CSB47_03515 [Proteobacteria bacterium]|nr:MAG: hypothetical protein CSB47_03515 [Pseudomonadota bacterium]
MPRPKTKEELINASTANFAKLWKLIDSMPDVALNTAFDFSADPKKTEAHWARDKNLRDVLVHLYEWHQLLIRWIKANTSGEKAAFLPEPFNWKTYGDMNVAFWEKHQNTSLAEAKEMVKSSHDAALALIATLSDEQLFTKKYFDWTGTTTVGSYCISSLSSHYDWAIKKLRAHVKNVSA